LEVNRIVLGDCQQVLTEVVDGSVDLIVTDPPYGYSFMGKDWDKAVPSMAIWKECLRVLKAGAFAFVMSSPRADVLSRMIVNLSDAGFRTDFTPIYWAYASGFPKAMNVSLQIDKQECIRQLIAKLGRKPIKDKAKNIDEFQDAWKVYRQVTGEPKPLEYAGKFDQRSSQDRPKDNGAVSIDAKLFEGSYGGFQPKPAVEVIIVAMKPLSEKTFVDQALRNGKGVTWLDEARIPFDPEAVEQHNTQAKSGLGNNVYGNYKNNLIDTSELLRYNTEGRFPANLLVSDDILNDGTISKSTSGNKGGFRQTEGTGEAWQRPSHQKYGDWFGGFNDEGSFSRYFSLDAWFQKTLKKLPLEVQRTFPFLIEPKASKAERNKNLEQVTPQIRGSSNPLWIGGSECAFKTGSGNKRNTLYKNNHPTVKPLQLMTYLITLGSRSNDLVLDPFAGSGTTCLAAKMLGRRFIGIEIKKEYVSLAQTRVNQHKTLFEFGVENNALLE
jgi:site-specific DNA-methyltransferase (adenine-specific)